VKWLKYLSVLAVVMQYVQLRLLCSFYYVNN